MQEPNNSIYSATRFTSDFVSFIVVIVVELIRFYHEALQLLTVVSSRGSMGNATDLHTVNLGSTPAETHMSH